MLHPISAPKENSAEDLIGYIGSGGSVVVSPQYTAGHYCFEGLVAASRSDWRFGFLDERGQVQIPFCFSGVGHFREGLCPCRQERSIGYIERTGRWHVEPQFAIASEFCEGLADVSLDGRSFGYIDTFGKFVIKPDFDQTRRFSCGLAAVCRDGQWGYVNRQGRMAIACQFDGPRAQPFTNGLAGVCYRGRWGFVQNTGEWVIMPQYEDVGRFSEGVAPVRQDGKWGLIGVDGSTRIIPRFDDLGEFESGMANASLNGAAGFVSPYGDWIVAPVFDHCTRFFGLLAVVQKGDIYSYVRRNGQVVWTSEPYAMLQAPPFVE